MIVLCMNVLVNDVCVVWFVVWYGLMVVWVCVVKKIILIGGGVGGGCEFVIEIYVIRCV